MISNQGKSTTSPFSRRYSRKYDAIDDQVHEPSIKDPEWDLSGSTTQRLAIGDPELLFHLLRSTEARETFHWKERMIYKTFLRMMLESGERPTIKQVRRKLHAKYNDCYRAILKINRWIKNKITS
jgi:hypothetical protein